MRQIRISFDNWNYDTRIVHLDTIKTNMKIRWNGTNQVLTKYEWNRCNIRLLPILRNIGEKMTIYNYNNLISFGETIDQTNFLHNHALPMVALWSFGRRIDGRMVPKQTALEIMRNAKTTQPLIINVVILPFDTSTKSGIYPKCTIKNKRKITQFKQDWDKFCISTVLYRELPTDIIDKIRSFLPQKDQATLHHTKTRRPTLKEWVLSPADIIECKVWAIGCKQLHPGPGNTTWEEILFIIKVAEPILIRQKYWQ